VSRRKIKRKIAILVYNRHFLAIGKYQLLLSNDYYIGININIGKMFKDSFFGQNL